MRLLKVYSEEKEKLELLVAAIAPAVEALSQLITDQTLNAAAGETALITLHNLVSALHTRSGLYARDRCAGARNASEFVLTNRDDKDVGMQATAATIFVSLLQQEHQAAQAAAAPAEAPADASSPPSAQRRWREAWSRSCRGPPSPNPRPQRGTWCGPWPGSSASTLPESFARRAL